MILKKIACHARQAILNANTNSQHTHMLIPTILDKPQSNLNRLNSPSTGLRSLMLSIPQATNSSSVMCFISFGRATLVRPVTRISFEFAYYHPESIFSYNIKIDTYYKYIF